MSKESKRLATRWRDIFTDPDMVGESEFLAIYTCVKDALESTRQHEGGRVPIAPETELSADELQHVVGMLDAFIADAKAIKRIVVGRKAGR